MKKTDKIGKFTVREIDAATCYLTYLGASVWHACEPAMEYWKSIGSEDIKITADNLRKFQKECDAPRGWKYWWGSASINIDCWGPTYECYYPVSFLSQYFENCKHGTVDWKMCERVLKANIMHSGSKS